MQTQTNLRLDSSLLDWLREQAENDNRSLNGYILEILTREKERVDLTPRIIDFNERLEILERNLIDTQRQRLLNIISSKKNMLIVGGTGSGKSILLGKMKTMLEQLKYGYEEPSLNENDSPINVLGLNGIPTQAFVIDDIVSSYIFSNNELTRKFYAVLAEKRKENIPFYVAVYPDYISQELLQFFDNDNVITTKSSSLTKMEQSQIYSSGLDMLSSSVFTVKEILAL